MLKGVRMNDAGTLQTPLTGTLFVLQAAVEPPLAPLQVQIHCGGDCDVSQVGPLETTLFGPQRLTGGVELK